MKTNIPARLLRFVLLASLAAAPLARAEDEGSTATVKLSAPNKPATLSLAGDNPWGGHDADFRILVLRGHQHHER
jgi:hypothetical protein